MVDDSSLGAENKTVKPPSAPCRISRLFLIVSPIREDPADPSGARRTIAWFANKSERKEPLIVHSYERFPTPL